MGNVQTTKRATVTTATGESEGFRAWLTRSRERVEHGLSTHLREIEERAGANSRLGEAVLYSVKAGGKRIRPILVLETCRVCGGRAAIAMPAALAIEFVHTFSLIHDDLPAMDNDDLRRGVPTNHKVYGEALAVLAGDWLATHAFSLLAACRVEGRLLPTLVYALARGTERMIEGQGADTEGEGRPTDGALVRYIHEHKTAALIEASCRLGATCAGASDEVVEALAAYGHHLGVAFQIADDCLDAMGSEAQMGKRVRKDASASKQTYPAAFGLEEARRQAERETEAALAALEPFGGQADRLRQMARYVIRRTN